MGDFKDNNDKEFSGFYAGNIANIAILADEETADDKQSAGDCVAETAGKRVSLAEPDAAATNETASNVAGTEDSVVAGVQQTEEKAFGAYGKAQGILFPVRAGARDDGEGAGSGAFRFFYG